ncbi:DUF6191 domain-containing protein [Streptomyces sp. NPDC048566]|uniref:DUF6191 domain-containing protein n=1 Tax=Streptomyces sp. NPDC048566 TaxID=3365569 RepID=UPI00371E7409
MFNPFEELFAPGRKHTDDERRRLELTRVDLNDGDPGHGPIDLSSGSVVVRPRHRPGDEAPDAEAPDTEAPDAEAPDTDGPDADREKRDEDGHRGPGRAGRGRGGPGRGPARPA